MVEVNHKAAGQLEEFVLSIQEEFGLSRIEVIHILVYLANWWMEMRD
jgi:hypothetical protein